MSIPISVAIIGKNSERTLAPCLEALKDFEEVLFLDNGSTDKTLEIARSYSNVRVEVHEFIGFGPMKNLATQLAKKDWVLTIDTDEVITPELLESIKSLNLDEGKVYAISRLNHYRGQVIKACGWYPDQIVRLFNKKITKYNNNQVHESIIVPQGIKVELLSGDLLHYSFDSVEGLLDKLQHYSTLFAQSNQGKKKTSVLKAILRCQFTFLKNYFFKKGFCYGYPGFIISVCNSLGVFFKYIKLYEVTKK